MLNITSIKRCQAFPEAFFISVWLVFHLGLELILTLGPGWALSALGHCKATNVLTVKTGTWKYDKAEAYLVIPQNTDSYIVHVINIHVHVSNIYLIYI